MPFRCSDTFQVYLCSAHSLIRDYSFPPPAPLSICNFSADVSPSLRLSCFLSGAGSLGGRRHSHASHSRRKVLRIVSAAQEGTNGSFCRAGNDLKSLVRSCAKVFDHGASSEVKFFFPAALGSADGAADAEIEIAEPTEEGFASDGTEIKDFALVSGSPVVIVEAPAMLKTAEPMPMMRPNRGLLRPGDAGRIIDRRPKDTWAVRFAVGAYLIDRNYFEPLDQQ